MFLKIVHIRRWALTEFFENCFLLFVTPPPSNRQSHKEEHLRVLGERPEGVVDHELQRVAQAAHGSDGRDELLVVGGQPLLRAGRLRVGGLCVLAVADALQQ